MRGIQRQAAALLLILAAALTSSAAANQPRQLTCPPSIIPEVPVSCSDSGTVLAGEAGGQRWYNRPRRGARWEPPPADSNSRTPWWRPPAAPAAAGSNATYSFLIEEAGADEFDLVVALHTQSGDADL